MTEYFDDDTPVPDEPDAARTGRIPRINRRDADRTRTHHVVRPDPSKPVIVDPDAASVWGDDGFGHHDRWTEVAPSDDPDLDAWVEAFEETPARRRRGAGVDPLLLRVGAIVGAAVLITPLLVGLRGDESDAELRSPDATNLVAPGESPSSVVGPSVVSQDTLSSALTPRGADSTAPAAASPASAASEESSSVASRVASAPAPSCDVEYTIVFGDYWLRLAAASRSDLDDLLAANDATTDTPLYPGTEVCLPAGATTPAPPSTTPAPTEPPTTQPSTTPAPTEPPTTQPSTTPAPTEPPTTQPSTPPSSATVADIIRFVWPDELEDRAVMVATRESSLVPTARNYCCYGLFQIYYEVHQGWLASLGITRAEQLFDAATNARAAYALYQRSGGWAPWAMTAG